jgi:hypothetical protein
MPVALVTFVLGDGRVVSVGDVVAADDPAVVGREQLFRPEMSDGVEQATAAPGERRQRRKLS